MIEKGEVPIGLIETYQHVAGIFRLEPVQQLVVVLLTSRIAFAPADAVSSFKLQVSVNFSCVCCWNS